ncbi:MAG: butyrate kinase [Erysipelotrichaceae bacterium]|nr:butyrate kinase [Erysipelotrichaceae bacterium]MBR3168744.1 butyrate kinase [Erysipelotrichaceae bacterium]
MKKIIAINLGSTSTKVAYFENDKCVLRKTIDHEADIIRDYKTVWDQKDFRMNVILDFMKEAGVKPEELSAFVTRGGHTIPVVGGVYYINETMADMSRSEKYGNHISDVGLQIAREFESRYGCKPLTVDSPCTDEFEPLARYSGLKEIPRVSRFHALNQKAAARKFAEEHGKRYEDLNLIVVHLGGGSSCAAHKHGLMVDGPNGLDGDGPFSTNRSCGLPVGGLIDMCYSGQYTRAEMRKKINGLGGLMSYIGETDMRKIEAEIARGNHEYKEATDAMIYQEAKEIAAMAAVLKGKVDAIIFTGGIAFSEYVISGIREYISWIAPIYCYPGEFEMESLGTNAYKALIGEVETKEIRV